MRLECRGIIRWGGRWRCTRSEEGTERGQHAAVAAAAVVGGVVVFVAGSQRSACKQ